MTAGARKKSRNRQRGFTLLEILVAVTILGLAYLTVIENFSYSLRNIRRLEKVEQRNFTARLEREGELMAIPGSDTTGGPAASSPPASESPTGEVYVQGQKFQLVLVRDPDYPALTTLLLERRP